MASFLQPLTCERCDAFAELFDGYAKLQRPGANTGVLVCGPESLQNSVAETCRAFDTIYYDLHRVAFSYHSVSFDL